MLELTLSLFYAFAAILVFAALRVITARNPVHAVLYLVLSFLVPPPFGCCCGQSFSRLPWCWYMWAL